MPDFPSNTPVDTQDRFRTENDLQRRFLSPNLLVNPGFQHIEWRDDSLFNFGQGTIPYWLRYAPGWFPFGVVGGSDDHIDFSAFRVDDSPFRPRSGVAWDQSEDKLAGIYQEIPNASLLRGRRVRIAGCYRVAAPANDTTGISIFLKGQKTSTNVAAAAWTAGSLGYDTIDLPANTHAVLQMVPGLSSSWGGNHPVNIPCFDFLRKDIAAAPHLFLQGGEDSLGRGSATQHDVTVFTFEDGFSNNPAVDGSFRLYQQIPGAGLHYFEAFVDIPDDDDLFENDTCHLVVFSTAPGDVGAMDTPVTDYRLYAVTLEIVLDSASAEDRVLHGIMTSQMSPVPYGDATGRLGPAFLLRNPIYVPQIYPMFDDLGHSQGTQSSGAQPDAVLWSGSGSSTINDPNWGLLQRRWEPPGSSDYMFIKAPLLPPGSSVVRGSLHWRSSAGDNMNDIQMFSAPNFLPTGDSFTYTDNGKAVLVLVDTLTSGAVATTSAGRARRNRTGLYWNENAGFSGDNTLGNGTIGSGQHYTLFRNENGGDVFDIGAGWLLVVSDPRLAGASFLPEP